MKFNEITSQHILHGYKPGTIIIDDIYWFNFVWIYCYMIQNGIKYKIGGNIPDYQNKGIDNGFFLTLEYIDNQIEVHGLNNIPQIQKIRELCDNNGYNKPWDWKNAILGILKQSFKH